MGEEFVAIMSSRMRLRRVILGLVGVALFAVVGAGQDSPKQDPTTQGPAKQDPPAQAAPNPDSSQDNNLPSAPSAARAKPVPPPVPAAVPPASGGQGTAPAQASPAQPPPSDKSQSPSGQGTPGTGPDLGAPPDSEVATTIIQRVNEVPVVFTVTDRHGHYVKDLQKEDFQILDNNHPPAEVRSFHRETNLPLEVGLLVDASNSVRDRFRFEQDSAIEFLNQTVRARYDKAFVVGFDVIPEVTQDFTDNTELLSRGVRSLRPGGGTAMFDALYFACRDKLLKTQPGGLVRRAIVLLSDGEDNQSHVTREEAIDMAERAEVIVYTISTNVTGSPDKGDKVLERIADATGGRAFFPFQLTDIATNFMEIQEELRSQYMLSYAPADFRPDGSYHTIDIVAKNHKNLRVRSRRGYYAPTK
jgi:VWFA-related protein